MKGMIWLIVLPILAAGCGRRPAAVQSLSSSGQKIYKSGTASRTSLQLPDSSTVLMNANTSIRIDHDFGGAVRDVFLDGEALFTIAAGNGSPFVVHTRALVIRTGTPPAIFKVDGYQRNAGEQIDVLTGTLTVNKAYHSNSDSTVETLQHGEMVMINTDIDLMEKEKSDSTELQSWIDNSTDRRK